NPAAAFRLQPAHHAGIERRRQPRLARRHHRPALGPELLHHPRLDAAGGSGTAWRRQADPGHAGGGLRADRRAHADLLSDEAAQRPVDARVPGEVSSLRAKNFRCRPGQASARERDPGPITTGLYAETTPGLQPFATTTTCGYGSRVSLCSP